MARFFQSHHDDRQPDDVRMTLGEHLEELRSRLIRALLALFIGAVVCYVFSEQVVGFLTSPMFAVLRAEGCEVRMVATNPAENFVTSLKVSFIVGFILTAPYSLVQIWGFIAAGLYKRERQWVRRFAPASIILFFTGAAFLLLIVSPLLLKFLVAYQSELPNYGLIPEWLLGGPTPLKVTETYDQWPTTQPMPMFEEDPPSAPPGVPWINLTTKEVRVRIEGAHYTVAHLKDVQQHNRVEPMMRISEYVIFILQLSAAFGIGFQVPVVVAFVATLGIATAAQMGSLRRHIWFGMAVVSACITPPDVGSMLMLLVPMIGLLEIGLLVARLIERDRAKTATQGGTDS